MWIKIDQPFNSNISKASPSYSYNLFEQLISTLSNWYISKFYSKFLIITIFNFHG